MFWSALDLTTNQGDYRAHIVGSPSVADVDRDGQVEIFVATTVGYVYALHADGTVLDGFPVMMDQLVTQPLVFDIAQNGMALLSSDAVS